MSNTIEKYSNEMLYNILNNLNDLAQLVLDGMDDSLENQKRIREELGHIKVATDEINTKLDLVLEKLEKLESDFADVKNEKRDVEQKITLMVTKLSKLDEMAENEEVEDYYALAQSSYDNWEEYDSLTKKFIPLAEFLYSQLQKYDRPDYSPVILELCRAIENEFLLKIFKKYTGDLIRRRRNDLDTFLSVDRASSDLVGKTGQFVKAISSAAKTNKPKYTLGQMNTILSIAKDKRIVDKSPLLQDFVDYLDKNTNTKNLLDEKYIEKINNIVEKYRNPSAHPEYMSIDKADKCRQIMPDRLDYLIDCIN